MRLKLLSLLLFTALTVCASANDFIRGYYLDSNGAKVEGYIFYWSGDLIKFKSKIDSKPINLTPIQVTGFHINNQEYVVIQNFKVKAANVIAGSKYEYGFAEVIKKGRINLYKFRVYVNNGMQYGTGDYYLIGNGSEINQAYRTGTRFRKQIIKIVSDNESLTNKIISENLQYSDLEEIIELYNKSKK